ncbi:hypothetical protein EJB05_01696, partial [Eragrostis curvula]
SGSRVVVNVIGPPSQPLLSAGLSAFSLLGWPPQLASSSASSSTCLEQLLTLRLCVLISKEVCVLDRMELTCRLAATQEIKGTELHYHGGGGGGGAASWFAFPDLDAGIRPFPSSSCLAAQEQSSPLTHTHQIRRRRAQCQLVNGFWYNVRCSMEFLCGKASNDHSLILFPSFHDPKVFEEMEGPRHSDLKFSAGIFRRLSLRKVWRRPMEVSSSSRWLLCSAAAERGGEQDDDDDVSAAHQEKPVLCSSFWTLLRPWLLCFLGVG